jgi:hypothetical protein
MLVIDYFGEGFGVGPDRCELKFEEGGEGERRESATPPGSALWRREVRDHAFDKHGFEGLTSISATMRTLTFIGVRTS